ncbi:hypothetical protein [Cohaesibacter intestini]|uniref:hypothetical protein n=1 Tax=Cohaesibacter intestini TaxID=2211145 RepID=UPI000DE96AD3|nr:hypothetical protein [Cohaesibacter intestini]
MKNAKNEVGSSTLLERILPKTSHGWFMAACCALMVIGVGIAFAGNSQEQTLPKALLSLAPIAGCFVMHLVMHRMMGRSCHQADHQLASKGKAEPR